ncbi:putative SLC26A/SulP transporter [Lupinus albus]|uniref:Putative SLC26A/SulP transporter n=1 Tax=Lupinus albus TaxID=3870 RepID=A0A6A4PG80_LUPAL|nr:putative SLC26A/SulP transporter [Lupinus albus]
MTLQRKLQMVWEHYYMTLLFFSAVTAIDTSGLDTLCELKKMLEKRLLQLVLANPVGNVTEKLHQSKILENFGLKGVYLTVGEAVTDISSSWKPQP